MISRGEGNNKYTDHGYIGFRRNRKPKPEDQKKRQAPVPPLPWSISPKEKKPRKPPIPPLPPREDSLSNHELPDHSLSCDPLLEKHKDLLALRRMNVIAIGRQIIPELLLHKPEKGLTYQEYKKAEQAILTFYFEIAPQVTNISDNNLVWIPETGKSTDTNRLRYLSEGEIKNNPTLQSKIDVWFEEGGLLYHTVIAANMMITLLKDMQRYYKMTAQKKTTSENSTIREIILAIDPYLMGINMLLHDLGRVITHDRIGHAIETQYILASIGIDAVYHNEPDVLGWFGKNYENTVAIPHLIFPSEVKSIGQKKPQDLLFHLVDVLSKAREQNPNRKKSRKHPKNNHQYATNSIADIGTQISERAKHYNNGSKEYSRDVHYAQNEAPFMNELIWWLESENGAAYPRERAKKIIQNVRKHLPEHRKSIGIKD